MAFIFLTPNIAIGMIWGILQALDAYFGEMAVEESLNRTFETLNKADAAFKKGNFFESLALSRMAINEE